MIQEACEARDGVYVNLGDLFTANGTRGPAGIETFAGLSDDFHPNDRGHALIARRLAAAIDLR